MMVITADTAAPFAVNWANIVSTGGTVSTSAYFDLPNGAGTVLYSRVGVPGSEAGMSKFTIPRVRNVDAGLDVGFALVNTGTTAAKLDATLRSAAGSVLATKNLTLAAGAHTAAFAREFFGLTGEGTGTNYSFVVFESASAQFAATALAIEGGSLSSFPISTPGSGAAGANAEVADGSVTTVKLSNAAVTAAKLAAGAVTTDKLADNAITGAKIGTAQVVKSINSLKDDVTLTAGTNVTITPSGNTLTIAATGGSAVSAGGETRDLRAALLRMWGNGPVQGKFPSLLLPVGSVSGIDAKPLPRLPNDVAFDGSAIWVAYDLDLGAGLDRGLVGGVLKLRPSDLTILDDFQSLGAPRGVVFDGVNVWFTESFASSREGNVVQASRPGSKDVRIATAVGRDPWGLAFDGANIWVANYEGGVTRLRASDGAPLGSPRVGSGPTGVVFDGANIWVTNNGSNTVTKVRASDNLVLGNFATGSGPAGVAFDGANIWVTNNGDNTVTKLRASDGASLGSFATGSGPTGVAFDGVNIWVTSRSLTLGGYVTRY